MPATSYLMLYLPSFFPSLFGYTSLRMGSGQIPVTVYTAVSPAHGCSADWLLLVAFYLLESQVGSLIYTFLLG